MLKKTLSKSRLSPDTLDTVKMGVMLRGKSEAWNEDTGCFLPSKLAHVIMYVCFVLGRLGKLLRCCDCVICTAHNHGRLVAAGLFQHALQLPHRALHGGPRAQVHFADDDEDRHLQGHGKTKMLPCCTS